MAQSAPPCATPAQRRDIRVDGRSAHGVTWRAGSLTPLALSTVSGGCRIKTMSERSAAEPVFSGGRASVRIYMAEVVAHIDPEADNATGRRRAGRRRGRAVPRGHGGRSSGWCRNATWCACSPRARPDGDESGRRRDYHSRAVRCRRHRARGRRADDGEYVRHVLVRESGKLVRIVSARDPPRLHRLARIAGRGGDGGSVRADEHVWMARAEQLAAELLTRAQNTTVVTNAGGAGV